MSFNLYACGGLGVNIANRLNNNQVNKFFIDTSKSNLKEHNTDSLFILDNVDGAGKFRPKTYEHFKDIASDVLIKFKPSETLNVVLSSLSGGSGSVIAPLITKELVSNGFNTIVIGVDSKHSAIELENTIKTLKTYRSVSSKSNKSIALFYLSNTSREETDLNTLSFLNLLIAITKSEGTTEFDTTDLHNFINFEKVTDNEPNVGILEVNLNKEFKLLKNTNVVSTILVTSDVNSSIKTNIPEYLSTCVVLDEEFKNKEIRIDNILGELSVIVSSLDKEYKNLMDNKKLVKVKEVEIDDDNEDGIVL